MKTLYFLALSALITLPTLGCSSSSSNNTTTTEDSGSPTDAATDATSTTDGGAEAAAVNPEADAASSDAGAIMGAPTETWSFVPFADSFCRDGSNTGIGLNLNPDSTNLIIYLEGGGACFNSATCLQNPSKFGPAEFQTFSTGEGLDGIFDRTDTANPVKDWNIVYIPYCTGDVHAGNKPDGTITNVTGTQMFVGYQNITRYLKRIVPTLPNVTHVLLSGASAGGFGSVANFDQVAAAFPTSTTIDLLDDSGPFMAPPYLTSCLQQEWASTWGFADTILAACGTDCPDATNYATDFAKHILSHHPNTPVGLIDSTDDGTISVFFGFGQNNCDGFAQLTADQFTAGLDGTRTALAAYPNYGSFVFSGTAHTSIVTAFKTRSTTDSDGGTILLSDWITALTNGTVTNAGP